MKQLILLTAPLLIVSSFLFAQEKGDVIINEIGYGGTGQRGYRGGDYVELLVINPAGVQMGGWFLTDLSSTSDVSGVEEGAVRFSDEPGSVFQNLIPQGTYILICLGSRDQLYGNSVQEESVSLDGGRNRIVVFADGQSAHLTPTDGTIRLSDEDNVALLRSWSDEEVAGVVTWKGTSRWKYEHITRLDPGSVEGQIAYFIPKESTLDGFYDNSDSATWVLTTDVNSSTPGFINPGVDDTILQSARARKKDE
jgi:hypothetical protein